MWHTSVEYLLAASFNQNRDLSSDWMRKRQGSFLSEYEGPVLKTVLPGNFENKGTNFRKIFIPRTGDKNQLYESLQASEGSYHLVLFTNLQNSTFSHL